MVKKFFCAAALILVSLCFADNLSAGNFGITAGANFHTRDIRGIGPQTMTQWNAGFAYKCNLPLGFQLHPTLLYNVKAASVDSIEQVDWSVGYIEFMPSLQWGVDLILLRPYLEVSPFVGYGMNGWGSVDPTSSWNSADRFEYGVGVGGGVQIWRFQLSARYNWTVTDIKELRNVESANFDNVTLSLTYFFGNNKK